MKRVQEHTYMQSFRELLNPSHALTRLMHDEIGLTR
jgi:hypothetical protein